MFQSTYIINRIRRRALSIIMIVLFIAVCLIPISIGASNHENCIEIDTDKNQTIKSFDRCYFFIYGKISNPRIEEQCSSKYLVFNAERVRIVGVSYGYKGPESITQWIYSEVVEISWKTSGPNFRGLVTKNFILGTQRYRYF